MFRTLPTRAFRLGTRTLKKNQTINLDQLLEAWVGFGYESVSTVLSPGEFSRRGGIVDVFPPALPRPIRIEFFGDEVESLRSFDPASQRSLEPLEQVIITPATELLPKNGPLAAEKIKTWDTSVLPDDQEEMFEKDRKGLIGGVPFRGIEFYLPLLHSDAVVAVGLSAAQCRDRARRRRRDRRHLERTGRAGDRSAPLGGRRSRPAARFSAALPHVG